MCVCMNIHDLFMHIYVSSDFLLLVFFLCLRPLSIGLFVSAHLQPARLHSTHTHTHSHSLTFMHMLLSISCILQCSLRPRAHSAALPLSHSAALSTWLHFKLFTLANVTRCVRKFLFMLSSNVRSVCSPICRGDERERARTGWLRCCSWVSIAVCAVCAEKKQRRRWARREATAAGIKFDKFSAECALPLQKRQVA